MATMELNAELLKELSTIVSDENMVKDVIRYIRQLRHNQHERPTVVPYTMRELNERIDRAEAGYVEGRYTESEKVHEEINNLLISL